MNAKQKRQVDANKSCHADYGNVDLMEIRTYIHRFHCGWHEKGIKSFLRKVKTTQPNIGRLKKNNLHP
jgi:hypothetical protein